MIAQIKLFLRKTLSGANYYSQTWRWSRRAAPLWRILMYHRITSPEDCGYTLQPGMFVRPETFRMHMRTLDKHALVLPLETIAAMALRGESPPKGSVAITFDDGWSDNYSTAYPILKQHGFPATIFLATRVIGTAHTFWSDLVAHVLTGMHRERITPVVLAGKNKKEISRHIAALAAVLNASAGKFETVLDNFITGMKKFSDPERNALAEELANAAVELIKLPAERKFLSWDECREMQNHGITFGNHTCNHVSLSGVPESQVGPEVTTAQSEMEHERLYPLKIFCYPEGAYSPATQSVLAGLGFTAALSTERQSKLSAAPVLLSRVGIHQDIASTPAMFVSRIWSGF